MASHNRKLATECSLNSVQQQKSFDHSLSVVIFDAGSSDGTREMVLRRFPQVRLINGSSDKFWSASMAEAENEAAKSGFDYLLWLNDDVVLTTDAVRKLIETSSVHENSITVGATEDPTTNEWSYGALKRQGRHPQRFEKIPLQSRAEPDTFNGNVVLVPRQVWLRVGRIDGSFGHALADIDYGLRAKRSGIKIVQTDVFVGTCPRNQRPKPPPGLVQRWEFYRQPKALPWASQIRFMKRHGGWYWPLLICSRVLSIVVKRDS